MNCLLSFRHTNQSCAICRRVYPQSRTVCFSFIFGTMKCNVFASIPSTKSHILRILKLESFLETICEKSNEKNYLNADIAKSTFVLFYFNILYLNIY